MYFLSIIVSILFTRSYVGKIFERKFQFKMTKANCCVRLIHYSLKLICILRARMYNTIINRVYYLCSSIEISRPNHSQLSRQVSVHTVQNYQACENNKKCSNLFTYNIIYLNEEKKVQFANLSKDYTPNIIRKTIRPNLNIIQKILFINLNKIMFFETLKICAYDVDIVNC